MNLDEFKNEHADLYNRLMALGGKATAEYRRGGEEFEIIGDELLHTTWMYCGPREEYSNLICLEELEAVIKEHETDNKMS